LNQTEAYTHREIAGGGERNAGKIDIPTMIIHGTDDEVVPYWHGTELYSRASNPYKVRALNAGVRVRSNRQSLIFSL
jgi:pimeloyl-ACP methyl ester carboxylesterase